MTRTQNPLTQEYILMGLLSRKPAHGYDLYREVLTVPAIAMIWRVKQSQLYALLDKLEKEGLLSSQLLAGENFAQRRVYCLTAHGRDDFETWMNSPVLHGRDMRQEFLARLYFSTLSSRDEAISLIARQRAACLKWQADLAREQEVLIPGHGYEKLVNNFRLAQVQAMLDWLALCEKELSNGSCCSEDN